MHLWKSFVWNAGGRGESATFVKQAQGGVPPPVVPQCGLALRAGRGLEAHRHMDYDIAVHPSTGHQASGSEDSCPVRPAGRPAVRSALPVPGVVRGARLRACALTWGEQKIFECENFFCLGSFSSGTEIVETWSKAGLK